MPNVSQFLIERLENAGVKHVFGVPGEYVSNIFTKIESSNITLIPTVDECGAGFAADAYARIQGAGAVCVTYNYGAFKIINAVAAAYAERSPLIVISGAPGVKERQGNPVLRHMNKTFSVQKDIFEQITCDSVVLDDPSKAGYQIDRVLESLAYYKQPIYIEVPRDMADKAITYDVYKQGTPTHPETDSENLDEALNEVTNWLASATNPVILAGVEIARFELGITLQKFAERTNIPIVSTLLSKSVISEEHPMYKGVYAGGNSNVRELVEDSDCLLVFGVSAGDVALNYIPTSLKKRNLVSCTVEELRIKNHAYRNVGFVDFMASLLKSNVVRKSGDKISVYKKPSFNTSVGAKLTARRMFEKVNSVLDANSIVIADVGVSLQGAADLVTHHNHAFLGHALYKVKGAAIPSALGASMARPTARPFVFVGDGSFQTSMNELGTLASWGVKPIVFILNNKSHATEKLSCDGSFNTVNNWEYHNIVNVLGGTGISVRTEDQLDWAIQEALKSEKLYIINAEIEPTDVSLLSSVVGDAFKRHQ